MSSIKNIKINKEGKITDSHDPIAMKTSWKASHGDIGMGKKNKIKLSHRIIAIQPSRSVHIVAWLLLTPGLAGLIGGLSLLFHNEMYPLGIILIFKGIMLTFSGYIILKFHYWFTFDKQLGGYYKGFKLWKSIKKTSRTQGPLTNIHAIQLLYSQYNNSQVSSDRERQETAIYQLNLVFKDASRLCILDGNHYKTTLEIAKSISSFIKIPTWVAAYANGTQVSPISSIKVENIKFTFDTNEVSMLRDGHTSATVAAWRDLQNLSFTPSGKLSIKFKDIDEVQVENNSSGFDILLYQLYMKGNISTHLNKFECHAGSVLMAFMSVLFIMLVINSYAVTSSITSFDAIRIVVSFFFSIFIISILSSFLFTASVSVINRKIVISFKRLFFRRKVDIDNIKQLSLITYSVRSSSSSSSFSSTHTRRRRFPSLQIKLHKGSDIQLTVKHPEELIPLIWKIKEYLPENTVVHVGN